LRRQAVVVVVIIAATLTLAVVNVGGRRVNVLGASEFIREFPRRGVTQFEPHCNHLTDHSLATLKLSVELDNGLVESTGKLLKLGTKRQNPTSTRPVMSSASSLSLIVEMRESSSD
jgi:hypothetical protein